MRTLTTVAIAVCFSAGGMSASVSASCCFPFPGFWGVGYFPVLPVRPYAFGYGVGYRGCPPCRPICCPAPCCSNSTADSAPDTEETSGSLIRSDKVLSPVRDPGFRDGADQTSSDIDDAQWNKRGGETDEANVSPSPTEPRERKRPGFLDQDRSVTEERDFSDSFSPPFESIKSETGHDDFGSDTGDEFRPENHGTQRPPLSAPVDDLEKSSGDKIEGDVLAPAPGSEESARSWLLRGILTNAQARDRHTEPTTCVRLAGPTHRYGISRPVHWSGRGSKRQPSLQWIEAPVRNGRIRL